MAGPDLPTLTVGVGPIDPPRPGFGLPLGSPGVGAVERPVAGDSDAVVSELGNKPGGGGHTRTVPLRADRTQQSVYFVPDCDFPGCSDVDRGKQSDATSDRFRPGAPKTISQPSQHRVLVGGQRHVHPDTTVGSREPGPLTHRHVLAAGSSSTRTPTRRLQRDEETTAQQQPPGR